MADVNTLSAAAKALWGQVTDALSNIGYTTTLTSAGRTASANAAIPGASSTSQHIGGNAFDYQVFDTNGNQVDPTNVSATIQSLGLNYGQNIAEYGLGMNPRNHLSVPTSSLSDQNLVGNNGVYTPVTLDSAKSLLAQAQTGVANLQTSLQNLLGGSPNIGALAQAGGAADVAAVQNAFFGWLQIDRAAIAIVALLLLGAAIFSIAKSNSPIAIAKGIVS